ncbi:fibronectin type III domain-containing protein [Micromonospora lupini]|uniref:Fibronectin type-III domain-containing protein n=1 Tax=Micromonospora lupini str. Lupac 08 TaxID=1150864 RepID=I0LE10_9ACTN|nr:fibronectin type III domain-containing protein [Micromonospora lupini]CCH22057.1 Conserved hypothetical protein [Micromonospora lupini str. Lupac 08]
MGVLSRRTRWSRWTGAALVVALATGVGLFGTLSPAAAVPTGGIAAADLNSMFNSYGDAGGHWTGGDSTASVALPDGRVAWLFSDTFLGTVNADGSRPANTPMVNNTIVVQDGGLNLVSTRHGGTAAQPTAVAVPTEPGEYYWVADGLVEAGTMKVLYNSYRRTGGGNLDFEMTGTALATFALPSLTLSSVVKLPLGSAIGWGSALLETGGYTYIYGTSNGQAGTKFGHVARVPSGGLAGAWQFWTGTTWSAQSADAGVLLSGVGTAYGIQQVGSGFVLVTQDTNLVFNPQVFAYTAPAPTGPFSGPVPLLVAPEVTPQSSTLIYDARVHPELARSGKLLVSYNVNSLDNADNFTNARLYRPRFVEIDWPRPAPDPGTLPSVPAGLTATADTAGQVRLSWSPVSGAKQYWLYQRNVTAGQTHFSRQPYPFTDPTALMGLLTSGHQYEFRVAAENAVGQGPLSSTASATPYIAPPSPPSGIAAAADTAGRITLTWTAVAGAWGYDVLKRDVTEGVAEFDLATRLGGSDSQLVLDNLEHNHRYEFVMVTRNGGGESPRSLPVSATATYALPAAPTALTATPNADGSIKLSWAAPADVWFRIYHRDVTAGEGFTQLPLPVTECCTMVDKYLLHNHEYEYKVTATNRGGEGPASNLARATSVYPLPAAPANLRATAGVGTATLQWDASADTWFSVYRRNVTAGEADFTQLPLPVTTCCTITLEYLANNETYEFKVAATNQAGASPFSNAVQVTPRPAPPPQVTGVGAIAQSDGTIQLNWTQPNGSGFWYDVYMRDVTAGASFTKLAYPVTICCTVKIDLLTHRHVYEFKVAATNGLVGPQSAVVQATSTFALPPTPPNLRGRTGGDGSIDLDWDSVGQPALYWVYYRDKTAGATFSKASYPTDRTNVTMEYLVHGHVYEFKVSADNQGGEGPASAVIQVTSLGGLPKPASNLAATTGDGTVRLTWSASPSPNVYYDIYQRDVTAGESWKKLPYPVTTCCTHNGNLLNNGHTYEWKVVATNASGASGGSNVVSGRPMPPLPATPTNLAATVGDGTVRLTWTASASPNVYYDIYQRDVTVGQAWQKLPYPVTICCAFNGDLLANGHTYEWRIRATNITGASGYTSTVSGRPMPPIPSAPSGLTATVKDKGVVLKWTASSTRNVWYLIYQRDVTAGQSWQKLPYPVTSCCTFTGDYLINGHTYEWKVTATNLSGISGYSNTVSGRPMPPAPKAPSGLTSKSITNGVELHWTHSSTPDVWYRIYYRNLTDGQTSWTPISATTPNNSFTVWDKLPTLRVYEFQVAAYNLSGEAKATWTAEDVPRRVLTGKKPNRPKNDDNGSNNVAMLWALDNFQSCQWDYFQTVCFGLPPSLKGQPITVGDFMFYKKGSAALENELECEAWIRLRLRQLHGPSVASEKGRDLLWHEQVHSAQWTRYRYWGAFVADYFTHLWEFEGKANLYWGSYETHPDAWVVIRDGSKCP